MLYVAMFIIICLPCFFSFYSIKDSVSWLRNYKSPSDLLKIKLYELLINSLMPAIVLFPFALFIAPFFLLLKINIILISINVLIFYCYYLCYPFLLMSLLSGALFTAISIVLFQIISFYAIIPVALIIIILHIISKHNINESLYVKIET
jgi:hypothetical protein